MVQHLSQVWNDPSRVVPEIDSESPRVWRHNLTVIDPEARFVAPAWIGAGVKIAAEDVIVGPTVLWDRPPQRRAHEIVFSPLVGAQRASRTSKSRRMQFLKRGFDIVFSLCALAVTLPLYPFILLAIYLEDGRPFLFVQRRETLGGRIFPCLKFRSMRKDAERVKHELATLNRADGPQFYIDKDPRLTYVGAALRKLQLDELPQFFNVLVGHMSVVGPRPSPYSENQYCPPWREARLSVRAGITGLWQVMRTRRNAADFQEWIRYDIQYIDNLSWKLDLWIIWRTCLTMLVPFYRMIPSLKPKPPIAIGPPAMDSDVDVSTIAEQ
jgi:lipopolysaccharide/colanic/teichoic acid biosynthesis glycosyltransferase